LKARLPRTWSVLFARHGGFTAVQRQAIPTLLAGRDTLVIAPTASGKTEAVVAPLLERHVLGVDGPPAQLRLLYVCPTRALVRDLYERLVGPLGLLGVQLAMKTGDTGPVSTSRPPAVLLSTPESVDALLTRSPRLLADLRALVLDEIHLLDGTVRGDQLRCLLARIARIHAHRQTEHPGLRAAGLQRVALSATVGDPSGVAGRYLHDAAIIEVKGDRVLRASQRRMKDLSDLAAALAERAARKSLLFCNTRHEVEQVATYLRQHLPYEAPVFTHYSNLDTGVRRQVEADFAAASVALCVASSTLELGIDIGSIDDIVLVGAPLTVSSFRQRVGRGGRRGGVQRVLCLARTPTEALRFAALVDPAPVSLPDRRERDPDPTTGNGPVYHFKPSVLVQQVFSLLKQSPTGGLRFADLRGLAPDSVDNVALQSLLARLVVLRFLVTGRPGEWRPGPELATLADEHEIYANIGGEALKATVVDAFSGRRLAQAARPRRHGESLQLGGRQMEVAWQAAYTFGVRPRPGDADPAIRFRTTPYAVPLELTQAMAAVLGLAPGQLPVVSEQGDTWLFHFWGDLFGALLASMLESQFPADAGFGPVTAPNELCLRLPFNLDALPPWDGALVETAARELAPRLEPVLELGRFHPLLPPALGLQTVVEHCDLPRLGALYGEAVLMEVPDELRETLLGLL
jgi:ATP-dependent Lhr-like helicase